MHQEVAAGEAVPQTEARWLLAVLIGLAFTFNTVGRGIPETFAVFLLPVEQAFGATRSDTTLTYSIFMAVTGIAAPIAGQLVDRFGARTTYGAGLTLLGGGYMLAGNAASLSVYYVGAGCMAGLGAACLGMVVGTSLMSRWFSRRVGAAMAVPYAAIGFGALVMPPFAHYLMSISDWRIAHMVLGAIALCFLPLIFLLPLARLTRGSDAWRATRQQSVARGEELWSVRRALATPAFWSLFAVYFWTAVAAYSVLPHSVAYLVEQGFDEAFAAYAFGFTGALSTVGIIAMGLVSDRVGRLWSVLGSYLITAAGIAALIAIMWQPAVALIVVFVVAFGGMQGVRGPVIAALVAILYRGGAVGSIFGTLSLALGSGAALGSWASGALHDATGDYLASFALAIGACVLGAVSYAGSGSLRRERLGVPA
ncbi:MAG: MFS transporter [Pseudomonadota bacterium]